MGKRLYGPNGSVWERVRHIPHPDENRGIVRFSRGDSHYRNEGGVTHKLVRRGRDNWATPKNFNNRKR